MLMLKIQNALVRDPLNFKRDVMTAKVFGVSQIPVREALKTLPERELSAGEVGFLVAGIALLPELGGGILIVIAVLFGLSGVQLVALAVVGEYVWSALAEARRRPQYVIEAATSDEMVGMTVK